MSLGSLNSDEKQKLKTIIESGIRVLQECSDLKSSLSDTVKAFSEEIGVKPVVLNKAIRLAFKNSIKEEQESNSEVEELLHLAGHI